MKTKSLLLLVAVFGSFSSLIPFAAAQGTAFTYQGRLDAAGSPANGLYDLQFALFDAASGGTQQSGTWTQLTQGVTNGLFTVELDFGSFFPGASRWLQIGVRTNGGSSFTTLTPRQKFAATPYAITAGNFSGSITAAQLPAGVVTNSASGVNLTGNFSGNGANVTNVNAATLGGLSSTGFWKTNGNAGANPTNGAFLGTTDNLPLEFRVNGARVLRLEPNAQGVIGQSSAPNVIGGWAGNRITNSAVGATIWGGGSNVFENVVGGDFGTVSGGRQNSAGGAEATVAGGRANAANGLNSTVSGGYANTASGLYGTVSGGEFNLAATADFAAIGGGLQNTIQSNAYHATIGGGANNNVQSNAWRGTVGGGAVNTVGAPEGTVAGGAFNSALAFSATVGGGGGNAASGEWSTIAGGRDNLLTNANYATIGGGYANVIQTNSDYATIGGGGGNTVPAVGHFATIPGGRFNSATNYAFAAGTRAKANHTGAFVWADSMDADFASTGNNQFLIRAAGGVGINNNNPTGAALAVNGDVVATSFRGDGRYLTGVAFRDSGNQFIGDQSIYGNLTVSQSIAVGSGASAEFSAAAIGFDAQASGDYSTAIGAHTRATASYGMALGFGSQADHTGSFVWADATWTGFSSTAPNQFLIRAAGGVGINTASPGAALQIGDINTLNSQGMLRFASRSGTGPSSRYWDIGVPEGDQNTGGKYYSFVIDDPILGTEPEVVVRWDTGNVGIGITNPAAKLDVNGATIVRGVDGWDVNNTDGDLRVGTTTYRFKLGVSQGGGGAGDVWLRAQGGTARMFIKTPGGTTFYSNEGQTSGVSLAGGGGAWTTLSDRNAKTNFTQVNAEEVLAKVAALPLSTWNYKSQAEDIRHIGPMAQDFKAAFGVGESDTGITTVDADGVALAAIQGLNEKVEVRSQKSEDRIQILESENADLRTRLEKLEQLLTRVANGGAK